MNSNKVERLIQLALIVASEEDDFSSRQLGAIHLIKYVYLADLAYAERKQGQSYIGVLWCFHHYGPWSVEVYKQIEPALNAIGAIKNTYPSKYEDDTVRWILKERPYQAEEIERDVNIVPRQAMKKFIHQFGSDTESLLKYVYLTKPMLTAAPEEILNLEQLAASSEKINIDKQTVEKSKKVMISNNKQNQIRQHIQLRLVEEKKRRAMKKLSPAPRYDDIFLQGQEWLDSLAGEPIQQSKGELQFSPDIWKSKSRFDPDVS
jgi:hypothetical protein